ncbi:MAG: prepilin-type N-terminal cleavage/methylation domain-containing protein [Halioglobus sp.]
MWATGTESGFGPARGRADGFTMLELLVAISIAALLLAVTVPATSKLYESMQYRSAVRDAITLFASARYKAINSGRAQDVQINPETGEMRLNDTIKRLPEKMRLSVQSARELNRENTGVIRFYPEGGSSGGGVDIETPTGNGVKISVDWLVGSVSQQKYAVD